MSDDEEAFSGGFCVSLLEKISLVKGREGGRGSKREKMMWDRLWWELREEEERESEGGREGGAAS